MAASPLLTKKTGREKIKTVLVTGGTRRIGLAIANRLRSTGWRVVTASHRADAGADIVADLSKPSGAAALYAEALRILEGTPPDAIVNNAAILAGEAGEVETLDLESPKKLTMLMAGREQGRGTVVNILDAEFLSSPSRQSPSPYESAKRGLMEYTVKSAAMFSDTLRVNAVAPGPVIAPEALRMKAGETPIGRPTAEAVADAVAYLLDAESVTGCIIPVDGGQHLIA